MFDFRERDALYLRKSRMDPDSETIEQTLARHKDTLMKFAARIGLNVTGIYEEVVSGDGLFSRPKMVQLLQDVGQGQYTGILCMEIDRLGRSSQRDSGTIFETLKENNVAIITPNKTYDLNDEFDETSVEMQSFIARQELKSIKRRLRKGVEKTCEQGGYIAEPPFGYRRAYIDKRPTLEICEDEAKVVRMIYDMYVNQHIGGHVIARTLNGLGYHPRKNDHFSRNTIKFILENPTYTGKIIWNKHRHIRPKFDGDKHRNILNTEDKWIVADGIHPAIISTEMYDEAQKIRKTRAHPSVNTGELKNPFAGIIYCKNCGSAMLRQFSSRSGNRILCANSGCNRSVKTERLEAVILEFLKKALSSCKTNLAEHAQSENAEAAERLNSIICELAKQLSTLNSQKSALHDFLESGVYDVPTFLKRSGVISERIANINSEIETKENELKKIQQAPPIKEAVPLIEQLLDNYDLLSPAEKNQILKKLISRMTYLRTKEMGEDFELDIKLNYGY